jgi:hypothetical protein
MSQIKEDFGRLTEDIKKEAGDLIQKAKQGASFFAGASARHLKDALNPATIRQRAMRNQKKHLRKGGLSDEEANEVILNQVKKELEGE